MLSLLETLLAFVGVMLVLALAAQSLQELIKAMFALKGQAALHGLEGLIHESVRSTGLNQSGDDLVKAVVRRLQGLGQNGVRPSALRLDTLTAAQLKDLLLHVDPRDVPDLRTSNPDIGAGILKVIADRASDWFPLAMEPVADRYRRRMRGVSLATSAAIVLALNADALTIFRKAQTDDQFRQRVSVATAGLTGPYQRMKDLGNTCTATGAGAAVGRDSACTALKGAIDSLDKSALGAVADTALLAGVTGPRRPKDPNWWIGILMSTLLVSLGAPFWHDALETLFGVKNRVQAQAKKEEATTPPTVTTRAAGPFAEAVIEGPADAALPS